MYLKEAPDGSPATPLANLRRAVAIGEHDGPSRATGHDVGTVDRSEGGGNIAMSDEDALQARLSALRTD